jgi:predicted nuclease of predicted toxin-antitoxin system
MTFFLDHDVPHDLTYSLRTLGHEVVVSRDVLPVQADDAAVLRYAAERGYVVITCNREDFVAEAQNAAHAGIILLFRRKTRAAERAALIKLLDHAGDAGIAGNINFA